MKRAQEIGLHATRRAAEHSNDRHPGLCRGGKWPCRYTTHQSHEIASFHYDPQTGSRHRTRPDRDTLEGGRCPLRSKADIPSCSGLTLKCVGREPTKM